MGRDRWSFLILSVLVVGAVSASLGGLETNQESSPSAPSSQPASSPATADDVDIEALIRDLGHPSYDRRAQAMSKLAQLGPGAGPALARAAESDDLETASRARRLLREMKGSFFSGVKVSVRAEKTSIDWQEPFDLVVELENESDFPARLPFYLTEKSNQDEGEQARQVGAMVDASDFLVVLDPWGQPLELTVDDITADPAVDDAVSRRASDISSPADELAPHGKCRWVLRRFNRGWARYRMLEAGEYQIRFDYTPAWGDTELQGSNPGRVLSNTARVEIAKPAPPLIQQARTVLLCSIQRDGEELVCTLTNADDLPLAVNTNWGKVTLAHAHLRWLVDAGNKTAEVISPKTRVAKPFDLEKIVTLAPGQSMEMDRISLADLRAAISASIPNDHSLQVRCRYGNILCAGFARLTEGHVAGNMDLTPDQIRALPVRMFSGSADSDPLTLPGE